MNVIRVLRFSLLLCAMPMIARISAQPVGTAPQERHAVTLELLKPFYKETGVYTFATGAIVLSYRGTAGRGLFVKAAVPMARFGRETEDTADGVPAVSDLVFGNPYVGLEMIRGKSPLATEVGVFLPTNSSHWEANGVGRVSDADRREYFLRKTISLVARMTYTRNVGRGVLLVFSGGGIGWIGLDRDYLEDGFEFFIPYSGYIETGSRSVTARAGISGRFHATAGAESSLKNAFTHQLLFEIDFHFRNIHPGFLLRIPLSEDLNTIRAVAGISFSVRF